MKGDRCSRRATEIPCSFPSRDTKRYVEFVRARRQANLVAADLIPGANLESADAGERMSRHPDRNSEARATGIELRLDTKILVEGPIRFRSVDHAPHENVGRADQFQSQRNRAAGLLRQRVDMPALCN